METTVYRKPTHTGRYLNFESNHSTSTKRGEVKSLIDRAYRLCNSEKGLQEEIKNIRNDLRQNGRNKKATEEEQKEREQIFGKGKKTIRSPDIKKISEESEGKTSRTEGGRKEMEELKELMREMMKQMEENMQGIRQEIKEMKKEMGEREKKWEKEKEKLVERIEKLEKKEEDEER
ncbi:hypothetical protein RN001_008931 [Aquatica leii]|uniref:Helix-turn-helix domain-containing protein n=1 Tax=Aquatica leii TaxID=1421715 RepID=A0AAN7SRJ8_9COLE|nr:hypothetical protein RN001_008931 [Aquatica leii]